MGIVKFLTNLFSKKQDQPDHPPILKLRPPPKNKRETGRRLRQMQKLIEEAKKRTERWKEFDEEIMHRRFNV